MEHIPITTGEVESSAHSLEDMLLRHKRQKERERVARIGSRMQAEQAATAGVIPTLDFSGLGRRSKKKGGAIDVPVFKKVIDAQTNLLDFTKPNSLSGRHINDFSDKSAATLNANIKDTQTKLMAFMRKFDKVTRDEHATKNDIDLIQKAIDDAPLAMKKKENVDAINKAQTESRTNATKSTLTGFTAESDCPSKYLRDNGFNPYVQDLGPTPEQLVTAAEKLQEVRDADYPIVNGDYLIKAFNKAQTYTDPQIQADMMAQIGRISTLPEELKGDKLIPIIDGTYGPADAANDAIKVMPITQDMRNTCAKYNRDYTDAETEYNRTHALTAWIVPYSEEHPYTPSTECNRIAAHDAIPAGSGRSKKSLVDFIANELKSSDCGCGCYGEEKVMKKLRGGALKECPPGYDNNGLTCLERCNSNEVDTGLFCMGPKNCPAGQRDDGTSCWEDLHCDTIWINNCVYWNWFGGYWTGCASTTCNGGPRVQTKQTRAKTIVGRVDWVQTGADIQHAFQEAFGPNGALARAFDPEKNGVAAAFREFGRNAEEAFKKLGSIIRHAIAGFIESAVSLVKTVGDFLGGIGATLTGEQSPAQLGQQLLGALSAVTTVAGTFVSGGAAGVAIRLLSNALTMLANANNGHPPTAADFAGLAADIIPGAKLGDAVRGAVKSAVTLTTSETEAVAGQTFAAASEVSMIPLPHTPEEVAAAKARIDDARTTMRNLGVIDYAKINVGRKAKEEAQVYCQFDGMAKRLFPDDPEQRKQFTNQLMSETFGGVYSASPSLLHVDPTTGEIVSDASEEHGDVITTASQIRDAYEASRRTTKKDTEEELINKQINYFKNIDTIQEDDKKDLASMLKNFQNLSEKRYDQKYYALHKEEVDAKVKEAKDAAVKKVQDAIDEDIRQKQAGLNSKLDILNPLDAELTSLITKANQDIEAANKKEEEQKNNQPIKLFGQKYGMAPQQFDALDYDAQQEWIKSVDYEFDIDTGSTDVRVPGRDIVADLKWFGVTPKPKPNAPAPPQKTQEDLMMEMPLLGPNGKPVKDPFASTAPAPAPAAAPAASSRPSGQPANCPTTADYTKNPTMWKQAFSQNKDYAVCNPRAYAAAATGAGMGGDLKGAEALPAGEQNAELAELLEGEGKPRRKKSKRV
jgi:hypothetical protein